MPDALPWDQFENQHVVTPDSASAVHVLGAGLAGCWMARTLAEAGVKVVVLEAGTHAASAASANPAGIVKPFVTRSPTLVSNFYMQAYQYLLERLATWDLSEHCQHSSCGVVQLGDNAYPASTQYQQLSAEQMQDALGISCDAQQGTLFHKAGWLNPSLLCRTLLQHPLIELRTRCTVNSIEQRHDDDACWLICAAGYTPVRTRHLVLTTGAFLNAFVQSSQLCITPARGQISRFKLRSSPAILKRVVDGKHYVIPDDDTIIVGATFESGTADVRVRTEDNQVNLDGLLGMLNSLDVIPDTMEAFAGVRATTPDRCPLVGPLPDMDRVADVYKDVHHGRNLHAYPALPVFRGAYVLGGLGARGIVTAPFSASLLTNLMMGGNSIETWSRLINPARFMVRNLKRQRPSNS